MMKIVQDCSPNFKSFFEWSLEYLKFHKKELKISNTKAIYSGGIRCGGICDGMMIRIARNNELFEQTYVHEFSHMNQAVEQDEIWDYTSTFWELLAAKKLKVQDWKEVKPIIALERDCERRALEYSKKWGLFDNKEYTRKANLYLHYYQFIFLGQKWHNSTAIYNPELVEIMPNELLPIEYFNKIDMDLMMLFDEKLKKCNIKK